MVLISNIRKKISDLSLLNWFEIGVVIFLLSVAFFVLVQGISLSLWQDEGFTLKKYVDMGPLSIMTGDNYRPNNHILYNLTIWIITSIFGYSETAVRLPSVLATVTSFLIVYLTARTYIDKRVALVTLMMLTLGSFHVSVTSLARGYGFLLLFGAMFTYFILKYAENISQKSVNQQKSKIYIGLAILFGFLATYTFPSFIAFAACVLVAVLIIASKQQKKEVVIASIAGSMLVIFAFVPLARELIKYYINFGGGFSRHQPLEWESFFTLPVSKVSDSINNVTPFILEHLTKITGRVNFEAAMMLCICILMIYGAYLLWKNNRQLFILLVIPSALFIIAAIVFSVPLGRRPGYTIFLEFNYLVIFCIGIVGLYDLITKFLRDGNHHIITRIYHLAIVGLIILILSIVFITKKDDVSNRNIPIENAKGSMEIVNDKYGAQDYVLIIYGEHADGAVLSFYAKEILGRPDVGKVTNSIKLSQILRKNTDKKIAIVNQVFKSRPISTKVPGLGEPIILEQRSRGHMEIYFIEPKN